MIRRQRNALGVCCYFSAAVSAAQATRSGWTWGGAWEGGCALGWWALSARWLDDKPPPTRFWTVATLFGTVGAVATVAQMAGAA